MKTVVEILTFAERVRKASVTFYGLLAPVVAVVATQDVSTPAGALAGLYVVVQTAAVYLTRNRRVVEVGLNKPVPLP